MLDFAELHTTEVKDKAELEEATNEAIRLRVAWKNYKRKDSLCPVCDVLEEETLGAEYNASTYKMLYLACEKITLGKEYTEAHNKYAKKLEEFYDHAHSDSCKK